MNMKIHNQWYFDFTKAFQILKLTFQINIYKLKIYQFKLFQDFFKLALRDEQQDLAKEKKREMLKC